MLPEPLVAVLPETALFYIDSLFGPSGSALRQLGPRPTERAEEPAPDHHVKQRDDRARHDPGEEALPSIHAFIPSRKRHRGFPSRRNWAWLFGKMRGAAMSN